MLPYFRFYRHSRLEYSICLPIRPVTISVSELGSWTSRVSSARRTTGRDLDPSSSLLVRVSQQSVKMKIANWLLNDHFIFLYVFCFCCFCLGFLLFCFVWGLLLFFRGFGVFCFLGGLGGGGCFLFCSLVWFFWDLPFSFLFATTTTCVKLLILMCHTGLCAFKTV